MEIDFSGSRGGAISALAVDQGCLCCPETKICTGKGSEIAETSSIQGVAHPEALNFTILIFTIQFVLLFLYFYNSKWHERAVVLHLPKDKLQLPFACICVSVADSQAPPSRLGHGRPHGHASRGLPPTHPEKKHPQYVLSRACAAGEPGPRACSAKSPMSASLSLLCLRLI